MKIALVFDTPNADWTEADFLKEIDAEEWEAEYDIYLALTERGHRVDLVGIPGDFSRALERLSAISADVVFNAAEGFGDDHRHDYAVASLLELYGHCYTGSPPLSLMLARDKAISKKILDYHGVHTPRFVTYPAGRRIIAPKSIEFPLIVKPVCEDASVGIAQASIVSDEQALKERVKFVHRSLGQPAIAEELVRGRELYVGIIGNRRPRMLPLVEMCFGKIDDPDTMIATYKAKWDWNYRERKGIKSVFPKDIDADTLKRIKRMSLIAYRALHMRDYGRVDIRLTADGDIRVLEVNPNPFIRETEDLPQAAERAGLGYAEFLEFIIRQALTRRKRRA